MGLELRICSVVAILVAISQVEGNNSLTRFSSDLQRHFIAKVFLNIAQKRHLAPDIVHLDNVTVDADFLTTVVFTHLNLLEAGREGAARLEGDYEIISNDVEQAFPRDGHFNVSFMELVKLHLPSAVQTFPVTTPAPTNHTTNLDYLVDFILLIVRDTLRETKKDMITLPDVDEPFTTYIIFPIEGRFKADGGWFKNLSTVHRTADTVATIVGSTTINIVSAFGLQTMEFGFHHYDANLGALEASGSLTGSVRSNSITIKISLSYVNETCKASLDSLKVTQLSGISVALTGWDGFGWLLSFIANCAQGSYRGKIVNAVEEQLSTAIQEKLSHFNCMQHFRQIMDSLLS
ncbi:uncharacterized protein [Periplaneta americana]|uniref:uncharacterized protein n=1 Tax=Periplaneta americana TaxID=6978 RepID=UPI0037E7E168